MFFEYGGTPRKMYPAVAAMARILGADFQFVRKLEKPQWLHAYEFRSRGRTVIILWTRNRNAPKLNLNQKIPGAGPYGQSRKWPGTDPRRVAVVSHQQVERGHGNERTTAA